MTITVILCTYNRCGSLPKTLASIAASTLPPPANWEVLVVDNNSTDQTPAVVEDFRRRFPQHFRYLFEPQPGKSFALNSGIREARGGILAFTDDDVIVEPMWLQNLTSALNDGPWAGTGGRTLPAKDFSPPPWLLMDGPHSMMGTLYAGFDQGATPLELRRAPYGANMAFRKTVFERYGGFRTDLGPSPNRDIPRPNEDTEFGRRLLAAGERLRYEPAAVVYHPIPGNRLRKDYFLNWSVDFGRAAVREWGLGPVYLGVPRRLLTAWKMMGFVLPMSTLLWMLDPNPRRRFHRKCGIWSTLGQISEIHRQLHRKRT